MLRIVAAVAAAALACSAAPITSLPGYNGPALDMDSGYVTVSKPDGRNIFYWHIAALNNPDTAPLVFWMQGGPGCSSLLGLFSEQGPFRVQANMSVEFFDVTWLQYANMVWFEQPVGVGFSYANEHAVGYPTNDTRAAADSYTFIKTFITETMPQYQGRTFWITGESYGGIYVPMTSANVLNDPDIAGSFTGVMIGNGVMRCGAEDNTNIQTQIFYWHGMLSYGTWQAWAATGCTTTWNTTACNNLFNVVLAEVGAEDQQLRKRQSTQHNWASFDPDDLFQDFCIGNGTLDSAIYLNDSCTPYGSLVQTYLNTAAVQSAINAKKPANGWLPCAPLDYTENAGSMTPYFEQLFNAQKHVLIYSGDLDIATVPMWVTQVCVATLPGTDNIVWNPWFVNGHTAGYWRQTQYYTFATLKGAGHEAPMFQPLTAQALFGRFLTTGMLNTTNDGSSFPQHPVRQGDVLRAMMGKHF